MSRTVPICVAMHLFAGGENDEDKLKLIVARATFESGTAQLRMIRETYPTGSEFLYNDPAVDEVPGFDTDNDGHLAWLLGKTCFQGAHLDLDDTVYYWGRGEDLKKQHPKLDHDSRTYVSADKLLDVIAGLGKSKPKIRLIDFAVLCSIYSIIGKDDAKWIDHDLINARAMGYASNYDLFDDAGNMTEDGEHLLKLRSDKNGVIESHVTRYAVDKMWKKRFFTKYSDQPNSRTVWFSRTLNHKQLSLIAENASAAKKSKDPVEELAEARRELVARRAKSKKSEPAQVAENQAKDVSTHVRTHVSTQPSTIISSPSISSEKFLQNNRNSAPHNSNVFLDSHPEKQRQGNAIGNSKSDVVAIESVSSELELEAHNEKVLIEEQTAALEMEEIQQAVVTNGLTDGAVVEAIENALKIETTMFLTHPDWVTSLTSVAEVRQCAALCTSGLDVFADQWYAEHGGREWKDDSWKAHFLSWLIDRIQELSGTGEESKPKEPDTDEPQVSIEEARAFAESFLPGTGYLGERWQKIHGGKADWAFTDWKGHCSSYIANERDRENKAKRQQQLREVAA